MTAAEQAEPVARAFHETYERLALEHGYRTREASAVPWDEVPEQDRGLMVAVVGELLRSGTIVVPLPRLDADELAWRHPGTTGLLRYFEHAHLPDHLQDVSQPVGDLAHEMVTILPDGPELTTALRKLLEAKDCLERCALDATITRSTPWVAPNARDAVAGIELDRRAGHGGADADGAVAMTELPSTPTRSHGMALPPGVERCAAELGSARDRCMYLDGHLEWHSTPDGRRFDA